MQADSTPPSSLKKKRASSRSQKENLEPLPSTYFPENCPPMGPLFPGKLSPAPSNRSPLPPRPPPNSNETPCKKKKLNLENTLVSGATVDSGVQVYSLILVLNSGE